MVVILKCSNGTVTDKYLEIIGAAIIELGEQVVYVNTHQQVLDYGKETVIVAARIVDAAKLYVRGYRKIIMWIQGVEPEESFMAHKSQIRFKILSLMEKQILQRALFVFFVSQEMKKHFETKYQMTFDDNHIYCMPCMNTQIHKDCFLTKNKYEKNYFAYIGSLAVWQKFEETVDVYKKIEDSGLPNTKLFVYTSEGDKAKKVLELKGIKNYYVGFVKNEELKNELKHLKYGFIIREDNAVNRVATPTKISTYLSCGMIPIYSRCLKDFDRIADNMVYVIPDDSNVIEKVNSERYKSISPETIYNEYNAVFESYYSIENHIKNMIPILTNILCINEF